MAIIRTAFEPVTIYPACATDPQSTRRIPTKSSTSQVGPRLRASPKNAIMKAKSLWSFGISLSIMKLMIKTQNGNVKKSKTLKLTGIYFTEPKYPRLITETQIPVTTIFNRNGELKTTCSLVFLRDFILLPVQKDHIPISRHVESIRKKTTVWGVAPSL